MTYKRELAVVKDDRTRWVTNSRGLIPKSCSFKHWKIAGAAVKFAVVELHAARGLEVRRRVANTEVLKLHHTAIFCTDIAAAHIRASVREYLDGVSGCQRRSRSESTHNKNRRGNNHRKRAAT